MKAALFITWIICLLVDHYYVRKVKKVITREDAMNSKVTFIDFALDFANIIIGLLALNEGGFIMCIFAVFLLFTGLMALLNDYRKYKNQKGKG